MSLSTVVVFFCETQIHPDGWGNVSQSIHSKVGHTLQSAARAPRASDVHAVRQWVLFRTKTGQSTWHVRQELELEYVFSLKTIRPV